MKMEMYDAKEIGNKISALRKQKQMTQKELALKLCLSSSAVSKWENGDATPDVYRIQELAEIFGVTVAEMIGVETEEEADREVAKLQAELAIHKRKLKRLWMCSGVLLCAAILAGIFLIKRAEKPDPVIVGIASLRDYVLTLQLLEGSYETDLQAGPGFGGEWTGQYELVISDSSNSEVINRYTLKEWQEALSFQEQFTLQPVDYNKDGTLELLIGQYGCSNYNFYRMYYITPEQEIGCYDKIGELMISSLEMSPVLEGSNTEVRYSYYNNSVGEMVIGKIPYEDLTVVKNQEKLHK